MSQEIVEAPIPGKIISVGVAVEGVVEEGEVLCMLESMKMENPILAPVKGVVKEIKIAPSQMVKSGETMFIIEY